MQSNLQTRWKKQNKKCFPEEENLFHFYEHFKVYESCDHFKAPQLSTTWREKASLVDLFCVQLFPIFLFTVLSSFSFTKDKNCAKARRLKQKKKGKHNKNLPVAFRNGNNMVKEKKK